MADEGSPEPPEPTPLDKLDDKYKVDWDRDAYDVDEMEPPDWITDLDREICRLLGQGLIFTPSLIAKNLDRPRSSVSRRLNTLEAGGIVEKVERGHYKLTDEGWARMNEKIRGEDWSGEASPPDDWIFTKILTPEEARRLNEK